MRAPRGPRLLPFLPPILLCVVAATQVYLTRTHHLSPWKGGGFGMFSTNDGESRRVEVWLEGPQGNRRLEMASDLSASRVAAYPSEGRLRDLARRVAKSPTGSGPGVDRVRVSVWRIDFDPRTMEPRPVRIRETFVDVDERSPR